MLLHEELDFMDCGLGSFVTEYFIETADHFLHLVVIISEISYFVVEQFKLRNDFLPELLVSLRQYVLVEHILDLFQLIAIDLLHHAGVDIDPFALLFLAQVPHRVPRMVDPRIGLPINLPQLLIYSLNVPAAILSQFLHLTGHLR